MSITFVGISFEMSGFAHHIYRLCLKLPVGPAILIPLYVIVMGLLGNVLDGVSIMAISVVIFLRLLPVVNDVKKPALVQKRCQSDGMTW